MDEIPKLLEPGIYRLGTKKYRVKVGILHGSVKAQKIVIGDIHDARKERDTLRDELLLQSANSSLTYAGGITVRTVKNVLDYYVDKKYKRSSRYENCGKYLLERLIAEFGDINANELTNNRVQNFVVKLQNSVTQRGGLYENSAINTYLVTLKAAFNFCVNAGVLSESPIKELRNLEVKEQKKQLIPQKVIDTIKSELPEWAIPITVYKELVPCRVLELFKIEMSQVSEDCRKIALRKDQTKNEEDRDLPVPLSMVPYFERMRAWGSPWAFARPVLHKDGTVEFKQLKRGSIAQPFRKIRDKHGYDRKIVYRKLRHTTVSQWLRKYDFNLVSDVAGASAETLRKYYDLVSIDAKLDAVDDFSKGRGNMAETLIPFKKHKSA